MNEQRTEGGEKALKILIAGGGIGGLSAAISLRQQGHTVEIFERSRFATETGAAIHLPSNANGILRRYGMIPEDHGANQTEWVSEFTTSGEEILRLDMRGVAKAYPHPWQLIHRVDLHNAMKDIATSTSGKGTPVILHLNSMVVNADADTPSLTLDDGSTHSGDLIVAADGVHSKIRRILLHHLPLPFPSGTSAFRFLIPTEAVRSDPATARFVEKTGEMRLHSAPDRRIVMYPCRNNTLLNFAAMHPDAESDASSEEWNQSASKELLLSCFSDFPADIQALLSKADPETIKLWKLLDDNELGKENWVRGKVALLGDAAHPFLPHQGQGGAQAIEDGAALGALFPLGTQPADVTHRLQLYVLARYDRATLVQDFTRESAFKPAGEEYGRMKMTPLQFADYNFRHDAYSNAEEILRRDLDHPTKIMSV